MTLRSMSRKRSKQAQKPAKRAGRKRVALYTRVSTDRQSAHELSEID